MPELKVYLLGAPHLDLNGRPVEIDRHKALALLAYLAVEGGSHTREALATMFWPDYDASRAYAYLRRTLWTLKDALGEGWLHADREKVEVRRAQNFWLDVEQFRACLKKCGEHGHPPSEACPECIPQLSQAADLYRADFLSGFSLRDSQAFDDWQFFQAESLRGELASALQRLVVAYTAGGEHEQAVINARRWLAIDPLDEEAQRALMLAYANSGQRNAAMRQYQESQSILEAELGVAPQPETTALYEQIRLGKMDPVRMPLPGRRGKLSGPPITYRLRLRHLSGVRRSWLRFPACSGSLAAAC